jgi:hypothetical protein
MPIKASKIQKNKSHTIGMQLSEVVLFYPIELGLGINTEVKKIEINFIFNTFSIEEKIYLLRSNKIPVN